MVLIQYPQGTRESGIAEKIVELEHTAWPSDAEQEVFPSAPDTYATSFVLLEGETAICHAGVRKSVLCHRGERYTAYGLSEVVTRPDYQNRGLASRLVKEAIRFIVEQSPDISVFTCERSRVPLYAKGGWKEAPGTCFVGGTREKPFRSDSLGLVTMLMLISPHGKAHRADFENTDLVFELGEGQLW